MEVGATSIGALLVAGVLGGGVAVGIDKAVGGEEATTVIREVTAGTAESTAFRNPSGKTISDIYGNAKRGVIQVLATSVVSDSPFFGSQPARALGSGFVIDKAGHVVTNYHVIEGASKVEVDDKNMQGTLKNLPERDEILPDINENLVVELYSK